MPEEQPAGPLPEEGQGPRGTDAIEGGALPRGPDIRNLVADRVRLGSRAVRRYAPGRETLPRDALAGLTGAIGSVPDGMAGGVLAGVNPVYGLYASLVGPIAGGLFASTQLMLVTTTSAAAIAAGQEVSRWEGAEREQALFLLVVLIGALQIGAGLLRLGSLTRFVSHSVMVGFLTGIAVLIVLGQLGTFAGYQAPGANKVMQAINLAAQHPAGGPALARHRGADPAPGGDAAPDAPGGLRGAGGPGRPLRAGGGAGLGRRCSWCRTRGRSPAGCPCRPCLRSRC